MSAKLAEAERGFGGDGPPGAGPLGVMPESMCLGIGGCKPFRTAELLSTGDI